MNIFGKRFGTITDLGQYLFSEFLWLLDSSRIDECICCTAVVAFGLGLFTSISFVKAMILLTGLQMIVQGVDVRKAIEAFRRLRRGK